jgi:hypothetical protein
MVTQYIRIGIIGASQISEYGAAIDNTVGTRIGEKPSRISKQALPDYCCGRNSGTMIGGDKAEDTNTPEAELRLSPLRLRPCGSLDITEFIIFSTFKQG